MFIANDKIMVEGDGGTIVIAAVRPYPLPYLLPLHSTGGRRGMASGGIKII